MKKLIKGLLVLLLCFGIVGCSKYSSDEEKKIQQQIEESNTSAEESKKLAEEYKKIADERRKSNNEADTRAREIREQN